MAQEDKRLGTKDGIHPQDAESQWGRRGPGGLHTKLRTPPTPSGRSRGTACVPRASLMRVTPPVAAAQTPGLGTLETVGLPVPAPQTITQSRDHRSFVCKAQESQKQAALEFPA